MSDHEDINKVSETTVKSHYNHHRTIVQPNLHQIQPRANQVWNCDEIGFDPNVKLGKVVCTYEYFQGKIMWKVQTKESAHHYGAPYLYLPELMGNASCLPSLFAKPKSITKISITISHWTEQSITHHLATWIDTGGLRP